MLGTVVAGGLSYRITRLELNGCKLVITAERTGKAPAAVNEPVTIFCADGTGFGQGGSVSIDAMEPWQTVIVTVTVQMETLA